MNIEKRASGSYRVRKTINGKTINVTFNHKPSEKEIMLAFAEKMAEHEAKDNRDISFKTAATKYNESKENVLSPTTMRSYKKFPELLPEWFTALPINQIEQLHINKVINELSVDKSPKTVRNYHGYISAVLSTFKPTMNISTTLPQKRKDEAYMPSKEDVQKVMEYFKEHYPQYYVGLYLCACGLRRGEMTALTPEDLDGDVLTINKSKALNSDNEWVIKSTKTTKSTRTIIVPEDIAKQIRLQGFVYDRHPRKLNETLDYALKKLGIPHFTVHSLRHYFCAVLTEAGVDEQTILDLGGWETPFVMKKAYRYSLVMRDEERKRNAMQNVSNAICPLSQDKK